MAPGHTPTDAPPRLATVHGGQYTKVITHAPADIFHPVSSVTTVRCVRVLHPSVWPQCSPCTGPAYHSRAAGGGGLIGPGSGAWCSHAWPPSQWARGVHLGVVSAAVCSQPRVRTSQNGSPLQGWTINFQLPCARVAGGAARLRRSTCEGSWPDPSRIQELAANGTCRGRSRGDCTRGVVREGRLVGSSPAYAGT